MATSQSPLPIMLLALFFLPLSLARLVPASTFHLTYHHGPLLAGPHPIKLLLTFYGDFEPIERSTLKAFLASLHPSSHYRSLRSSAFTVMESTSVSSWWSLTQHFGDRHGGHVSQRVELADEADDFYSLGKHLTSSDIATLVKNSARFLPASTENFLSIIFTSADVSVDGFCMHSCGGHSLVNTVVKPLEGPGDDLIPRGGDLEHGMLPYIWVGNPKLQCPGFCAWPFAKPQYGPPMEPLTAPNGIGVDGMIISLAKLLVNAVTNPAGNGFYQGDDASFGVEAGGMCSGKFGVGAYPGYPGEVMQNPSSGASFNMEGIGGVQLLVPWIWDPAAGTCAGQLGSADGAVEKGTSEYMAQQVAAK